MLDEDPNEVHDVLLLVTGMAEEDLISALALVEHEPKQAIFMREPSRQWEQRTYGELLPVIRSREAARASIKSSAPPTNGGRQASSSSATDQRAESSTIPADTAPTGGERGRGVRTSQTAAGGEPSSPRHRRPSREQPDRSAGTCATASPTRREGEIADDADAAVSREGPRPHEIALRATIRNSNGERTTDAANPLNLLTLLARQTRRDEPWILRTR